MSDMLQVLAMMAVVAALFATIRYLNLREERSDAAATAAGTRNDATEFRVQRIRDRRERIAATARRWLSGRPPDRAAAGAVMVCSRIPCALPGSP